jgi:hypothetical protein
LNIFQAELHTIAYLIFDRYKFKESAQALEVGSSSPVGKGEELFRDSGWLAYLEEAGLSSQARTDAAGLLSRFGELLKRPL